MKNLIEELNKLNNEEEYEVPKDFRKKVINAIEDDSSNIVRLKYIIPLLSSAAVIVIAVVMLGKGNGVERLGSEDVLITDYANAESLSLSKEIKTKSTEGAFADKFETMALTENMYEDSFNTTVAAIDTQKQFSKSDFYKEILSMFETNNIDAKINGETVRAKCTKEKAEEILYYFEDQITIKVSGEYVIVE